MRPKFRPRRPPSQTASRSRGEAGCISRGGSDPCPGQARGKDGREGEEGKSGLQRRVPGGSAGALHHTGTEQEGRLDEGPQIVEMVTLHFDLGPDHL